MTPLEQIQRKIKKTREYLQQQEEEKQEIQRNKLITCPSCNARHAIRDLTYIQTHWYVRPHGCTEGDYWNEGEGQAYCPSCNSLWRFYKNPEIMELKYLFKEIKEMYGR